MIELVLAVAAAASVPATDNWGHPFPQWVPVDVRHFVVDAQACTHFSGEVGYDPERTAFLQRMIRENCTNIEQRKTRLERRYRSTARIKKVIGDAWGD